MRESSNVIQVMDLIIDKLTKHETNKKTERNSREVKGRKHLLRRTSRTTSSKGDNNANRKKGKKHVHKKSSSKYKRKSK